jgi:hypothetical protein
MKQQKIDIREVLKSMSFTTPEQAAPKLKKALASGNLLTLEEIVDYCKINPADFNRLVKLADLKLVGSLYGLNRPQSGKIDIKLYSGSWKKLGLVADTNLCYLFAREDAL